MRKTIFETNFDRIVKLGIVTEGVTHPAYRKSTSGGYMDLIVERVPDLDERNAQKGIAISLAHYFTQNGDLCSDPEMVILVHPSLKMVEVLTFQQAIPALYQEVYPEPGFVHPKLKVSLNRFLRTWLSNLIDQDHGKNWISSDDIEG